MEDHKDYSATIKSCAIAFLCVCEQVMSAEDLKKWAKGEVYPDDFMDGNQVLIDIIGNHGIDTKLIGDGECPTECDYIFRASWDMTNELNEKKRKPKEVAAINSPYTLEDLHFSINDIFEQYDEGKINKDVARVLARRCCFEFIKD